MNKLAPVWVRVCCIMDQISGEARHRIGDLLKRTRVLGFDVVIVMDAHVKIAKDASIQTSLRQGG